MRNAQVKMKKEQAFACSTEQSMMHTPHIHPGETHRELDWQVNKMWFCFFQVTYMFVHMFICISGFIKLLTKQPMPDLSLIHSPYIRRWGKCCWMWQLGNLDLLRKLADRQLLQSVVELIRQKNNFYRWTLASRAWWPFGKENIWSEWRFAPRRWRRHPGTDCKTKHNTYSNAGSQDIKPAVKHWHFLQIIVPGAGFCVCRGIHVALNAAKEPATHQVLLFHTPFLGQTHHAVHRPWQHPPWFCWVWRGRNLTFKTWLSISFLILILD